MPFGKHSGKLLDEIPASYFDWLRGELGEEKLARREPEIHQYLKDHAQHIDQELEEDSAGQHDT
jgi:hypothetical protein